MYICQVFGQPKRPVLIPLGGLTVSLDFRFWGHNKAYESNHFLEQRRRMTMTSTLVSIGNKTTRVKRLRKGGFCFVMSSFFYIFVKSIKFFITKNLVITYKLSTTTKKYFAMVLIFLSFCHNLEKLAKKKKSKSKSVLQVWTCEYIMANYWRIICFLGFFSKGLSLGCFLLLKLGVTLVG